MSVTTTTTKKPKAARVALWDNARFLLMMLVVVGHTMTTVRTDSSLAFAIYAYIYLFHMPAMILLSGLFSRPEVTPKAIKSTIQLVVIWLLWEGIWAIIHLTVESSPPGQSFLVAPAWTLWFIVTLVTMRIILPYIAMLKHPMIVSIVIALVAGLSPSIGGEFSVSRTMSFLPFFVAGWLIRDRGLLNGDWFMRPAPRVKWAAWGVLAAIAAAFALTPGLREFWRIDRWLTWRDSYQTLFSRASFGEWAPSSTALSGIAVTAGLILVAAIVSFAVLVVVPRRASVITPWGSRTLFVYLLHGPIIWILRETKTIDRVGELGTVGIFILVIGAVLLSMLLSMTWVSRVFKPIVEPPIDWIFKRDKL